MNQPGLSEKMLHLAVGGGTSLLLLGGYFLPSVAALGETAAAACIACAPDCETTDAVKGDVLFLLRIASTKAQTRLFWRWLCALLFWTACL